MKKSGAESLGRALLIVTMIIALLSVMSVATFAADGDLLSLLGFSDGDITEDVIHLEHPEHIDKTDAMGNVMIIGYNNVNMTFVAYEDENFFSAFSAYNVKLYETLMYGEEVITLEVDKPQEGKVYRLGYANDNGHVVYFDGGVNSQGALTSTKDVSLAASVAAIPNDGGYSFGIIADDGFRYLGLIRDDAGLYSFFISDDAIEDVVASDAEGVEVRSRFIYDGEVLKTVYTRFVPDNFCDVCAEELPGVSDEELLTIIAVVSAAVIFAVITFIVCRIIKKKSVNYLFDNNGFR